MKYIFKVNKKKIIRCGNHSARIFAASIPPETEVDIYDAGIHIATERIDSIWELDNKVSFQRAVQNKLNKK